jgi:membrane-associated phospholipid phosphatase
MTRREKIGWMIGIGTFLLSFVFCVFAGQLVDAQTRTPVNDLILKNLGPLNVLWMLGWLNDLVYALGIVAIFFLKRKMFPLLLFSLGVLVMVKSLCMLPTQIGAPVDMIFLKNSGGFLNDWLSGFVIFNNDLFFSGHTARMFMICLFFYALNFKWWGILYFLFTLLTAWAVLAAHWHYTIDVIGAFLIAPVIFWLCTNFFIKMHLSKRASPDEFIKTKNSA